MRVELISTGNEIMSGITADTNFRFAADALTVRGYEPLYHTAVGDDRELLADAFSRAIDRADCVVVSGGLGPTDDDLTAEVAAGVFNTELELNDEAFEQIKERYSERGREVTELAKKQAYLPMGAKVLRNRLGTAPGFACESGGSTAFFLPGVPKEYRAMINEYVLVELDRRNLTSLRQFTKLVRTYGLKESEVAERLSGLEMEGIRLGYRSHFPEIHLRVTATSKSAKESDKLIDNYIDKLRERLGETIYSLGSKTLEEVVGELLLSNKMTLSTAESCTGGLLSHRITNVAGSSAYFLAGVVTYSNDAKMNLLDVPRELLDAHGAVSEQVVNAMAGGIVKCWGSDIGVGISGIAGPGGGTTEKPVGTVYIALATKTGVWDCKKYQFTGNREEIKLVSSETALDMIRKFMLTNV